MTEEIWKDIEGFEGLYQVSNKGNVKSLHWYGGNQVRLLALIDDHKGYRKVTLANNGHQRMYLVHRLVAKAFIPNPNNYDFVNHRDENKSNNCVENLEWCTKSYNATYYLNFDPNRKQEYADRLKKNPSPMTQRTPRTHLYRVNQYDKDGNYIATYDNPTDASIKTGIRHNYIVEAVNRNLRTNSEKKQRRKGYRSKAGGYIFEKAE